MVLLRPSITFYLQSHIRSMDQRNPSSLMVFHHRLARASFRQQITCHHPHTVYQTSRPLISISANHNKRHRDHIVRQCLFTGHLHCSNLLRSNRHNIQRCNMVHHQALNRRVTTGHCQWDAMAGNQYLDRPFNPSTITLVEKASKAFCQTIPTCHQQTVLHWPPTLMWNKQLALMTICNCQSPKLAISSPTILSDSE